jgi:anion-transporting  ArsA/GET3 family ATPase
LDLDKLLTTKKVLICCGSGGVGKTTLSAALGVRAAEIGLKVLVLTIDPARRLANSLGLSELNELENRIAPDDFKGELYASMLDVKKTFDDFITKLASSPEMANRVLENHVYQQISTALNGSQEYTALEKLLQVVTSKKYDLVVLDTPPTKHAIDFLNAPVKIHSLFQDSIIKWFLMPFTTLDKISLGLMNRGTKAALKMFEKMVGSEFLTTLTEFFSSMRDWQKILRDRTAEVHRLLTSSDTGFILVTGFSSVRIEEAKFFERSLLSGGYVLSAIIVNRAFPEWDEKSYEAASGLNPNHDFENPNGSQSLQKISKYYEEMRSFFRSQENAFKTFAIEPRKDVLLIRLPDFDQDVHDVNSLKNVAARLTGKN